MKIRLTFIFCLLLLSCSTDPITPKPTIAGTWEFGSTNLSGTFVVQQVNNNLKVVSGSYTVKTYPDYTIYESSIIGDNITLINGSGKNVSFQELTINTECTQIISTKQVYNTEFEPVIVQYEIITLTKIL